MDTPYHEREWTDEQLEKFVPAHIAENFDAVVAERYDGDYGKLAEQLHKDAVVDGQHGTAVLAAWARKKAGTPVTEAPVARTRKPKQTT